MKKYLVLCNNGGLVQKHWINGTNKKVIEGLYDNVVAVLTEKDIVKIKKDTTHKHHSIINKMFGAKK